MMFRIGQKVVCINDSADPGNVWSPGDKPTVGKVYEVLGHAVTDGRPCIYVTGHCHMSLRASRFRPAVDRKTDISFAHEILRKAEAAKEMAS